MDEGMGETLGIVLVKNRTGVPHMISQLFNFQFLLLLVDHPK